MKKCKNISRLLIVLFITLPAMAQNADQCQTTVYLGAAIPRSNLSEFAEQGLNIGVREVIPLRRYLSLMVSAEMFRNRLEPAVHAADIRQGFSYANMAKIYNIPIFAHLNFGYRFGRQSNFNLWTEGAMGVNFRVITLENGTFDYTMPSDEGALHYKGSFVTAYDFPKISLATQWGIGVTLFKRFNVGYYRYNLGRRSVTGERLLSNPHYFYDDGSEALYAEQAPLNSLEEFDLGKLRSRYHVIRFGVTF